MTSVTRARVEHDLGAFAAADQRSGFVSYSVTTVYLSDSSCAWISLASSNDVIDTHVSGRCINSIFRYASTILLLNSPSYSNAISTFNDGRKPLHLANVDSRLRRIDGYGDRCLLDTLAWSWRERKNEGQQQSDFYDRLEVARHGRLRFAVYHPQIIYVGNRCLKPGDSAHNPSMSVIGI
jgi:hypothetical protein